MGLRRIKIDKNTIQKYTVPPLLEKNQKHTISIAIDHIILGDDEEKEELSRINDSLRVALNNANGYVEIVPENEKGILLSEHQSCPECGFTTPTLEPRLFSFNNPLGCCSECNGLGVKIEADPDLIIPDPSLSINDGAIPFIYKKNDSAMEVADFDILCEKYGIDKDVPVNQLTSKQINAILYGPEEDIDYFFKTKTGSSLHRVINEGVKTKIDRLYLSTNSTWMKNITMDLCLKNMYKMSWSEIK